MSTGGAPHRLERRSLGCGVRWLARKDQGLAAIVRRYGPPPLWARRPGFATLIRIILEQQVSLASAAAVHRRLTHALDGITCQAILASGVEGLRKLGVTRQKAGYCHRLAELVAARELDLRRVARAPEAAARAELMGVPGIGPWTADIYLLMALRRPDIWPTGDVALLTALQRLQRLPRRPTVEEAAHITQPWTPWRSVAARILWHGYLSARSS